MKHLFILNPVAGKGKTLKLAPEIREYCQSNSLEYEIVTTAYPGHATELAAASSCAGKHRIYSVGGDGTLNEVLNGMAGTDSSLAVIPSGSGNDFIKSILGPHTPTKLIRSTVEGQERMIDYAKANDKFFLNITSVGFDAEVGYQAAHFKKLPLIPGQMAYVMGIFASILACKNHMMTLQIDGTVVRKKSLLIAVGNGKYYGGGTLAMPDAEIDDGLFDLCHVEEMSRLRILKLFPKYMKGKHASIGGVHLHRGKNVEIVLDEPIPMNLDGEIVLTDRVHFEIYPKALSFIMPSLE